MKKSKRVFLIFLAAAIIACTIVFINVREVAAVHRPVVIGANGMVCSNHPLASQAGVRILMQGGNAIDAVVATAATLNMVEPMMSGMGGSGFMLIYLAKTKEFKALNFTGKAPYAAKLGMFKKEDMKFGLLSATVPGDFAGWTEALKEYGILSLSEVFQPALEYAEKGVPISLFVQSWIKSNAVVFSAFPTSAKIFLPNGRVPETGEIYDNRDLAKTIKMIMSAERKAHSSGRKKAIEAGRDVLYKGKIAEAIAKFFKENGGLITEKDLADYRALWVEPISTSYRGYDIFTMPPNSSGLCVLEELNIMEGIDVKALGHNSTEYIHFFTEAIKLARSDRWKYIADPEYVKAPVEKLISKEYAEKQRERIDPNKASDYEQLLNMDGSNLYAGNTTHISVADREGNLVVLTQTLGGRPGAFGTKVVVGDTGLIIIDGINWLDLNPDSINRVEGGKRPRWNMCPIIVLKDGKSFMVIGTPGGEGIWQTSTQAIINVIDFGMNIQEAIEAPRFRDYGGVQLALEGRIPQEIQEALKEKGHKIRIIADWTMRVGGLNGIIIHPTSNAFMGGADPRREGYVVGW